MWAFNFITLFILSFIYFLIGLNNFVTKYMIKIKEDDKNKLFNHLMSKAFKRNVTVTSDSMGMRWRHPHFLTHRNPERNMWFPGNCRLDTFVLCQNVWRLPLLATKWWRTYFELSNYCLRSIDAAFCWPLCCFI